MQLSQRWTCASSLVAGACNYRVPTRLLVRCDSQQAGGVEKKRTETNRWSSHSWLPVWDVHGQKRFKVERSPMEMNVNSRKTWKCSTLYRLSDLWPCFSTHSYRLLDIPGRFILLFAMPLIQTLMTPALWAFNPVLSRKIHGAGSHEKHQLHCETLSIRYNLFCGVSLWQCWETERHTH